MLTLPPFTLLRSAAPCLPSPTNFKLVLSNVVALVYFTLSNAAMVLAISEVFCPIFTTLAPFKLSILPTICLPAVCNSFLITSSKLLLASLIRVCFSAVTNCL